MSPADQAGETARVIEAAYRCPSGKTGVPVTEILATAGLGTRAFYRHFDSEDALVLRRRSPREESR